MRLSLFVCLAECAFVASAAVFRHEWDTVADVMGMHGKVNFDKGASKESLEFAANNYAMITTGGNCASSLSGTLEDATLSMVGTMKEANSDILVGMYWRTDKAIEIADCTAGADEWNSHLKEWPLKDDQGNIVKNSGRHVLDYSNAEVVEYFRAQLLNVLKAKLRSGKPVLNYLYLDGSGGLNVPGIRSERLQKLNADKYAFFGDLQSQAQALGYGQNVILNGVDTTDTAETFAPTGVAGAMVDHWTILQFLLRGKAAGDDEGKFNVTAMDDLFSLVRSETLSNMTLHIKGWVGPIVKQRDQYPSNIPAPQTPEEFRQVAGQRFNSELSFFLLVAEDTMYWMYSWFWGFDDWVPGQPDSTLPSDFFPQAKCALGAPLGPPVRAPHTWTYTREYEFASVFVDLNNRTASRVDFSSCPDTIAI